MDNVVLRNVRIVHNGLVTEMQLVKILSGLPKYHKFSSTFAYESKEPAHEKIFLSQYIRVFYA